MNLSYSRWHSNGNAKSGFLDYGDEDSAGAPYPPTLAFVEEGVPSSAVDSVGCSLRSVVSDNVVLNLVM